MNEPKLPPLPFPWTQSETSPSTDLYTAAQLRDYARAAIAAQPASGVPEGWKLVPMEPTQEMIDAMPPVEEIGYWAMYEAAIAAAPSAPAQSDSANDARDAARYRWLRKGEAYTVEASTPTGKPVIYVSPRHEFDYAAALDKAIDAAMAREGK